MRGCSRTHLLTLEESLPITVGKVEGQGHDARGVLHSLDDPVQFPPAGTLVINNKHGLVSATTGWVTPNLPAVLQLVYICLLGRWSGGIRRESHPKACQNWNASWVRSVESNKVLSYTLLLYLSGFFKQRVFHSLKPFYFYFVHRYLHFLLFTVQCKKHACYFCVEVIWSTFKVINLLFVFVARSRATRTMLVYG